ncbi:MAG TPA: YfiR family protein [Candidatus Xenobia bacterium]|jgi:hypothetical protein
MSIVNMTSTTRFRQRLAVALTLVVLLFSAAPLWAQHDVGNSTREYDIKAAFVYNFALYVDWPAGTIKDGNIVFGVLGKNEYDGSLDELTKHSINNNHIVIKQVNSLDDAAQCQVLIVSPSEEPRYAQIFAALKGKPVLVVGETPDFAAKGGCIGFIAYRSRLRFEINLNALKQQGLSASSKLLNLATIVNGH